MTEHPAEPKVRRRLRASAPLVLGVYSGAVSGLAVLPVALTAMYIHWRNGLAYAGSKAHLAALTRATTTDASAIPWENHEAVRLVLKRVDQRLEIELGEPATLDQIEGAAALTDLCSDNIPHAFLSLADGQSWAWSCVSRGGIDYFAAVQPDLLSIPALLGMIFLLAAGVSTLTALVILRVLSPLSRIGRALSQVSAGQRDVRLEPTGLKELDELIARVNATATAAEDREDEITARLKAVKRVARIVAHEVRNPLQSLQFLTSLLVDETDAEERASTAAAMREEISNLDQVVSRLLKRSIADDLEIALNAFDLSDLLSQVERLHGPRARESRITLTIESTEPSIVVGDSALIRRCIENLLSNALQHARQRVDLRVEREPGWVSLIVDDDGYGVEVAMRDRIFHPDVSQRAGGSGLGLALVKAVADAHRGQIVIGESELGGASFRLSLPTPGAPR